MEYNSIKREQLSNTVNITLLNNSEMRAKKQRRKGEESTHDQISGRNEQPRLLKIKFNTSQQNLACFIDVNKTRRAVKATSIRYKRKPSRQKQLDRPLQKLHEKPIDKHLTLEKAKANCEDIIKEALNSVLAQIQRNGISCKWHDATHNESQDQVQHEASKIWNYQSELISSMESNLDKSYASTIDYYTPFYSAYQTFNPEFRCDQSTMFTVQASRIGLDPRTTIMIRNIPNKYTIKELADEINIQLANTYDFLYLPCDSRNQCNVGYGFINFLNTEYLREFHRMFDNHRWTRYRSEKICVLTYARLQGLDSLIEHFENSKVLNQKDKKYRPIINKQARLEHLVHIQQTQA